MNENHLTEDERKRLEKYLEAQPCPAELKDLHWVYGDDAVPYCYECAVKKVEEIKSEEPDSDVCVDGGWGTEEDGSQRCETCGKLLACSYTDYGSEEEIDHLIENGFDPENTEDCYILGTAISSRGWEVWSERIYRNDRDKEDDYNYFDKLHKLCGKILTQIDTKGGDARTASQLLLDFLLGTL